MTAPDPRENDCLFGHDAAEKTLAAALSGGRLHHAWLISGPEGVGKATLAFRFARRLLAGGLALDGGLALEPKHPVFHRVAAATHADMLTVEREWDDKKKRVKKYISAESAREIPSFLRLTPAEGGWRVVVVDGAEDMNAQSANALLKVLEEPPSRALLILTTAMPGRLLPTLRSRCRKLALSPLADTAMHHVLARFLPASSEADRARLIALSEGCPGRALMLAEQGGLAIAGLVDQVMQATPGFPPLRAYEIADGLKDEDPFDLFFTLLRARIADSASAAARAAAPARDWNELWFRLGEIHAETGRHNLDRRQAVVAGLGLL
jgi:DNA polymerase-3 subunit delta'